MRRMINDYITTDNVLDISDRAFRLYITAIVNTDMDGFFDNKGMLKLLTGASEEDFEELKEKNLLLEDNGVFVITGYHIMNTVAKNNKSNEHKYTATRHVGFKNKLYVTDSLELTTEEENNTPYKDYQGGAMTSYISSYGKRQPMLEDAEATETELTLEDKIREKNPTYFN